MNHHKITDNYEVTQLGDELLLLPYNKTECQKAVLLNELATKIYVLLSTHQSKDEMLLELLDIYQIEKDTILKDYEQCINKLIELDIISKQ